MFEFYVALCPFWNWKSSFAVRDLYKKGILEETILEKKTKCLKEEIYANLYP